MLARLWLAPGARHHIMRRKIERNKIFISAKGLRSGRRRHKVVKARQVLFRYNVGELGYAGAGVARYLGVSTS